VRSAALAEIGGFAALGRVLGEDVELGRRLRARGHRVELSAVVHGRTLLLAVADRGPGIPEADLPRLFERFFRGATARPGGTGLGLAIARGFTEANGGTVTAENRAGGGVVFTIRLPLQDPPTLPVEAGE
jgi:signal transduction histidine kinase